MKNYSAVELKNNYDNFIKFIEKVFSNSERKDKLLHMYSENELGMEVTVSPASGKLNYHSAYVGGYVDHVMRVCKNAHYIMKQFADGGGVIDFEYEELMFAALNHDLGKLGDGSNPYYIRQENEWARKNKKEEFIQNSEIHYMDVTHRALWLLNKYGIAYTEKEMLGILLSDGLYNKANEKYLIMYTEDYELKTELPYILHWADHMSCRIEKTQYKAGI